MMIQVVRPHLLSALRLAVPRLAATSPRLSPLVQQHRHLLSGGTSHRWMSSSTIDTTSSSPKESKIVYSYSDLAIYSPPRRPASDDGSYRTVYVHPLSQIILEYLQDCRHDWVVQRGLDQALTVHRDGSVELKFAVLHADQERQHDDTTAASGAIVGPSDSKDGNDSLPAAAEAIQSSSAGVSMTTVDGVTAPAVGRIWTSYDDQEKKHWLTVENGTSLHQRFLLQDNLLPAWHGNRKSLPERIHVAVDEMIRLVDRSESEWMDRHDRQ
jgi:hypothetical protein